MYPLRDVPSQRVNMSDFQCPVCLDFLGFFNGTPFSKYCEKRHYFCMTCFNRIKTKFLQCPICKVDANRTYGIETFVSLAPLTAYGFYIVSKSHAWSSVTPFKFSLNQTQYSLKNALEKQDGIILDNEIIPFQWREKPVYIFPTNKHTSQYVIIAPVECIYVEDIQTVYTDPSSVVYIEFHTDKKCGEFYLRELCVFEGDRKKHIFPI